MALDCLNGLVGLSNRDCPCVSGDQPSGWNDSTTGYFLTDTEYGFPLTDAVFANLECGEGSVWEALDNARTEAIRDFQSDLLQSMNAMRDQKIPAWNGLIGKTDGTFIAPNVVTGIQIRPRLRSRDAVFVVTAIHTAIETAGTYSVAIKSNDYEFDEVTETITVPGDRWARHQLATPVRLPFYVLHEESVRYSVELNANGSRVRNNKAACCGRAGAWSHLLDVGGFNVEGVNNELNYCSSTFWGVAVEGYFECAKLDWICNLSELNSLDFLDLVARCIQFKGAAKMISRVLESGRINYWTVLAPEALAAKRTTLQTMYADYVQWLVKNLPDGVSGCWGCMKNMPRMTTIFS